MKHVHHQGGHRTAPGSLRLGERARKLRQLHKPRRWRFCIEGRVPSRARDGDEALAMMLPPRCRMLAWDAMGYRTWLWVSAETLPGFRMPHADGVALSSWQPVED